MSDGPLYVIAFVSEYVSGQMELYVCLSADLRLDLTTDLRLGRRSSCREGKWWIRRVLNKKAGEVSLNLIPIVLEEKAEEVNFDMTLLERYIGFWPRGKGSHPSPEDVHL